MALISESLRQKIVKLSKMTVANGATEAEAYTAASKLAALLDEHGMTKSQLDSMAANKESAREKMEYGSHGDKKHMHEVQFCLDAIAKFFDCMVFIENATGNAPRAAKFFGFADDVDACLALTDIVKYAMESDFRKYMVGCMEARYTHGKTLRKAFMLGFASRIRTRLIEMKQERSAKTTGTALVVLKNQLVTTEFNKEVTNLKKAQPTTYKSNAAYTAGYHAAGNLNLNNHKKIA